MVSPYEQGSEFHLIENISESEPFESPWDREGLFFGTGRDALKAVLSLGIASSGWKRLWIPAYFCQTVVRAILETGIKVHCYRSWYPGETGGKDGPCMVGGDVVFVVNYFGLNSKIKLRSHTGDPVAMIEDHTHDPWSSWAFNSNADYCVASLRKVLPVPDGAVLWSPRARALPSQPALVEEHRLAVEQKLEAMKLKGSYLRGVISNKSVFRSLETSGEKSLCGRSVSAISPWSEERIGHFPVSEWRQARNRNHRSLCDALSSLPWVRVLRAPLGGNFVPFSCILIFDGPGRREYIRLGLIRANIYPAILWPLEEAAIDGIPDEDVQVSRRVLSIHCDMRYTSEDMVRVAETIQRLSQEFQRGGPKSSPGETH
jgi:hypothetical protein